MDTQHWSDAVSKHLGGEHEKPPKVISHMVHRKSATNGDHIFEHHHTHPEHHPMEVHTKRGDDEMVEHMLQHAGTPNPGEAEADAGTPDAYSPAGASGAAPGPSPAGSGGAGMIPGAAA